jgi:hypothetical protein
MPLHFDVQFGEQLRPEICFRCLWLRTWFEFIRRWQLRTFWDSHPFPLSSFASGLSESVSRES